MTHFKTNLRYVRKKLSLSQEELAIHVNVRSTTISNWENGASEPAVAQLAAICQFFGFSVDEFLFQNLQASGALTDEHVEAFRKKKNLPRKAVAARALAYKKSESENESVVNEGEENLFWAVLQTLRQMDGKLDQIRDGIEEIKKK